jgi:hypothetical protein
MVYVDIHCDLEWVDVLKRDLNDALRKGWEEAAIHHQEHHMPEHFEQNAYAKYGYQPRTKAYMIRKAKQMHQQLPLVWSGVLKKAILESVEIRATAHGARLTWRSAPWLAGYIAFRGRSGTGPDKLKELQAVTQEEIDALGRVVADTAMDILAELQNRAA